MGGDEHIYLSLMNVCLQITAFTAPLNIQIFFSAASLLWGLKCNGKKNHTKMAKFRALLLINRKSDN